MSIGDFARATLLSVNALRSYHAGGILVPATVDPSTGYRSYHPGQIADAAVLRRLRELDLPLDHVREILVSRRPDVTHKVLAAHEQILRARLAEVERAVGELQRAVADQTDFALVYVKAVEHQYALALQADIQLRDLEPFLSAAYPRLVDCARRGGFGLTGHAAALYEPISDDGLHQPTTAYLPVSSPGPIPVGFSDCAVIELPEQELAIVTHRGRYGTIGESYATLGSWVAYHGESASNTIRELYRVSIADTDEADEFLTDICWPVNLRPRTEPGDRHTKADHD